MDNSETNSEQQYRAIASYEPVHGDEIKLTQGDIVIILHSYDDGWVLAKNNKTLAVGLLPRNFLVTRESQQIVTESSLSASERRSSMVVRKRATLEVESKAPSPSPPSPVDNEKNLALAMEKWENIQKSLSNRVNVAANIGCLRVSVAGDSGIGKVCF